MDINDFKVARAPTDDDELLDAVNRLRAAIVEYNEALKNAMDLKLRPQLSVKMNNKEGYAEILLDKIVKITEY